VGLWGLLWFKLGFRLGVVLDQAAGVNVTLREFKSCFATAGSRASDATSPSISLCLCMYRLWLAEPLLMSALSHLDQCLPGQYSFRE